MARFTGFRAALIVVATLLVTLDAKLMTSGLDLMYNGEKVFLSGCNYAWFNYGNDFGNGGYSSTLETWLQGISDAGGNSVRVWVHVEGIYTPIFNSNGYVTACDSTGDFIPDIQRFLDAAQTYDILVIFALFNGASKTNQNVIDLFWDDTKLDSYISNCFQDLVTAVAGHPALAAWEAVNEPEGSVLVSSDPEECYDTTLIGESGAGWTGVGIPMERNLRTIGRLNEVVHANDPTTLKTIGSWGQFAQSDAFYNTKNHYKDACLNLATGLSNSHIDFYQMHTYDWDGVWSDNAPFTVTEADYQLDKPLLLGEYSSSCGAGTALRDLYEYAYNNGYDSGWSWHWAATGHCTDPREMQRDALGQLAGRTENGVVDFDVY